MHETTLRLPRLRLETSATRSRRRKCSGRGRGWRRSWQRGGGGRRGRLRARARACLSRVHPRIRPQRKMRELPQARPVLGSIMCHPRKQPLPRVRLSRHHRRVRITRPASPRRRRHLGLRLRLHPHLHLHRPRRRAWRPPRLGHHRHPSHRARQGLIDTTSTVHLRHPGGGVFPTEGAIHRRAAWLSGMVQLQVLSLNRYCAKYGSIFHFWCPVPIQVRTNMQAYLETYHASQPLVMRAVFSLPTAAEASRVWMMTMIFL